MRGAAGLLVLALSTPVAAQTVSVVGGEHLGFTRIVLQSAQPFDWTLREDGRALRITVPNRSLRADPARIFALVPRLRLADVRLEGPDLVLDRACDCPATAFVDRPGVLVIDLGDAPGLAPTPVAAPSDPARAAGAALAQRLTAAAPPPAPGPDVVVIPDATVAGLVAELARAVTGGMVAPDPGLGLAMGARASPVLPAAPPGDPAALPPNLRLHSPAALTPAEDPAPPPDCPAPDTFAFLDGVDPAPFGQGLAQARAAVYGEFDRPNPDGAAGLARFYLTWGLGAEARQTLAALDPAGTHATLGAAADAVDGVASNRARDLAQAGHCPGPVAIFAALAGAPNPILDAQAGALAVGFLRLPAGLRISIGPDLAERLIGAGALEGARIVIDALDRAAEGSPDLPRLHALMDRARGDLARAGAHLDAPAAPDLATLRLRMQVASESGTTLAAPDLDLAVALAEGAPGTALTQDVITLVIEHHAGAGRMSAALAALDRLAAHAPTDRTVEGLREDLWRQAAQALDDHALLDLVLARTDWRELAPDGAAGAALAARLAPLGLAWLPAAGTAAPTPLSGAAAVVPSADVQGTSPGLDAPLSPAPTDINRAAAPIPSGQTGRDGPPDQPPREVAAPPPSIPVVAVPNTPVAPAQVPAATPRTQAESAPAATLASTALPLPTLAATESGTPTQAADTLAVPAGANPAPNPAIDARAVGVQALSDSATLRAAIAASLSGSPATDAVTAPPP